MHLSFWAYRHKWPARILIVCIHIALIVIGVFIARLLLSIGINLASGFLHTLLGLIITAALVYPHRIGRFKKARHYQNYVRQKACDFVIALSFTGVIVFAVNNQADLRFFYTGAFGSIPVPIKTGELNPVNGSGDKNFSHSTPDLDLKHLSHTERKNLRKEVRSQFKKYRKTAGNGDDAGKAGVIILLIILAIGLTFLLSVLACSLACDGMGGLALLVILGGGFLVWFGFAKILKGMKRKSKTAKKGPSGKVTPIS